VLGPKKLPIHPFQARKGEKKWWHVLFARTMPMKCMIIFKMFLLRSGGNEIANKTLKNDVYVIL
jgi:hypothetical protein